MKEKCDFFNQRIVAIDILRALTMLMMIFVNDLWTITGEPDWIGHALPDQDFMGLADIVFPCFLIVVGMSIPFAIESRFSKGLSTISTLSHILTRTLALLIMGVFIVNTEYGVGQGTGISMPVYRILMVVAFVMIWNSYPKGTNAKITLLFRGLKVTGMLLLLYLALIYRDYDGGVLQTRWWGILGLIGWAYFIGAIVYLFTRNRLRYLTLIWISFIILCMIKSPMRSGDYIIDLPQDNFLYQMLDILQVGNGCLPALTIGGVIISLLSLRFKHIKDTNKVLVASIMVISLLLAGIAAHQLWIVSKIQATLPWLFYNLAISVVTFSILYWLSEIGKTRVFSIISVAGTATLTCYLVPYVTYSISSLLGLELPEFFKEGYIGIINCIIYSFMVIFIAKLCGKIYIKLKI